MINPQWLIAGSPSPYQRVVSPVIVPYAQQSSCMLCHQGQATHYDFVWSLALEAEGELWRFLPSAPPPTASPDAD